MRNLPDLQHKCSSSLLFVKISWDQLVTKTFGDFPLQTKPVSLFETKTLKCAMVCRKSTNSWRDCRNLPPSPIAMPSGKPSLPAHRRLFAPEWRKTTDNLETRVHRAKDLAAERFNARSGPLPSFQIRNGQHL